MQNTKTNLSPYFDDFDRSKNYQRVLFKPGTSIQSRELTTLQSILQNQIERFGQHVFKEGSVVIPGQVGYDLLYNAVLIQPLIVGNSVENIRESLVGKTLRGTLSNVKAKIVNTISAEESEKNYITFYVKYTSSGNIINNVQVSKFQNNEVLVDENNNQVAVTAVRNATDYIGSAAFITNGVYFIRGFFVEVLEQNIILDQYNPLPTYKVGLDVVESIVTAEEDSALYDNAVGASNFSAPGADRLKIEAIFTKKDLNFSDTSSFIELLRFNAGNPIAVTKLTENSVYAELEKNLARRTFDESGNYTIKGFNLKIRETFNNGENNGVYNFNEVTPNGEKVLNRIPVEADGLAIDGRDYYTVEISPGKAYIKGFEIDNRDKKYLTISKPKKFSSINNRGLVSSYGTYFDLNINTIRGIVQPGNTVFIKSVTNNVDTTLGKAKVLSLLSDGKLFVIDVTLYTTITVSANIQNTLQVGDFIISNQGAQGIIESVSPGSTTSTITLRQVTGTFYSGNVIKNSRNTNTYSITTVKSNKIEDASKITSTSFSFSANLVLEEVSMTGTSFKVLGNALTGSSTNFQSEVNPPMKLLIGDTIATVVSKANESLTLDNTVSDGTFYNVKKLVPKLKNLNPAQYLKILDTSIKSTSDFTYYKTVTETKLVEVGGTFTISPTEDVTLVTNDILVTNGSGVVPHTATLISSSSMRIEVASTLQGTEVFVTYKKRVNSPSLRTKTARKFKFLQVSNSITDSSIYGTRLTDNEISLKFPDAYKIHAIHEAIRPDIQITEFVDHILVNDSSDINPGDILNKDDISARVVSKDGLKLYVKYFSENKKFPAGTNLAIQFVVSTNRLITGRYITTSVYGKYRDITSSFHLVKNDSGESYNVSKLVRNTNSPTPINKFIVVYDYFEHFNNTNDFYTVNSYNTQEVNYENITLTSDGYPYTDIIDFRHEVQSGSTSGGTLESPYIETISSLDYYSIPRIVTSFSYPGDIVSLDYDCYLGRIDKLYIDENGQLTIIRGADSLTPKEPNEFSDNLLICTISIPPYMKNIYDVRVKFETNPRYTMKDISLLESRIRTIEETTSLNLLEVNTNTLNITDADGNNRFKNGFVADSFKSLNFADMNNPSYSASIDIQNGEMRPYPYINNVNLDYDENISTALKVGTTVTLPYTETLYAIQDYASRVENLQPFESVNWTGEISISPDRDVWFDTIRTQGEAQELDLETPFRGLLDASGGVGDVWGEWETNRIDQRGWGWGGWWGWWWNWWGWGGGPSITETQNRDGRRNTFTPTTQDIQLGDTFNGMTNIRFARSRIIDFISEKMKPDTFFYFFADGVAADAIIYPKDMTGLTNRSGTFVVGETVRIYSTETFNVDSPFISGEVIASPFGVYGATTTYLSIGVTNTPDGSQLNPINLGSDITIVGQNSNATGRLQLTTPRLKSDSFGAIRSFITLPPSTYETGEIKFALNDTLQTEIGGISNSSAETTYSTEGTQVEITSNVLSVSSAEITSTPLPTQTRTLSAANPWWNPPNRDPIAQSFFIEEEGGIFVSSIEVFFQTKDSSVPVSVELRTMENGTVTETVIPYSVVTLAANEINVSSDSRVGTKFTFPSPVYLKQQTNYAFIVRTTSKNYKIWVSRLAEQDIATGVFIDKQPFIGSLFKSQNMVTWTEDQFEDIKFKIYRAKFDTNVTKKCVLVNTAIPEVNLRANPLSFTENNSTITVFHPNHGMHGTFNYVKLSGAISIVPETTLVSAISSGTQVGAFELGSTNDSTEWTKINNTVVSASNPGYIVIDNEIIRYNLINGNLITIPAGGRGQFGTTAAPHSASATVYCYNLNGIPLNRINTVHQITEVIDLDSYKISVPQRANSTLISGGRNIFATRNIPFEQVYSNVNMIVPASCDATMTCDSTRSNSIYGQNTSFARVTNEAIQNRGTRELTDSRAVLSSINKNTYFPNANGSFALTVNLSTTSDNVSPIIDVTGSSVTTISNRIRKKLTPTGEIDILEELTPLSGRNASYICKKVTLTNTSTSIKVLFDAIRKQGISGDYPEIKVYAKINSDSNLGSFNNMNYIELPSISYPISTNSTEYKAFDFEIKNLPEFKEFSVKIVMLSSDQSNVPIIKNFRSIALAV
jgi:hypothetical protein